MIRIPAYLLSQLYFAPDLLRRKFSLGVKRIFDFVVSLFGIILLTPLFFLLAVLIKLDSEGPVFYRGPRSGKGGRVFKILKFRTMKECPESYSGPRVTCRKDSRVTKLGAWLRESKLNEIPQLLNVLKGDMSLVGPRPEDPEITINWPEDVRKEVLSLRPGITSPASVIYHDEENLLSSQNLMKIYVKEILPDKIRLDRLYYRHRSFFSDLDILFLTIVIILPNMIRRSIHENEFFAGYINLFANRVLSWFLIDFLTACSGTFLAELIWRSQQPINWGVFPLMIFSGIVSLFFSLFNISLGLHRILWSRATVQDAARLVFTSGTLTFVVYVLNYVQEFAHVLRFPALPRSMILFIGLFTLVGFLLTRYRWRLIAAFSSSWLNWRSGSTAFGERVVIVGAGENSKAALWLLRRRTFLYAFNIIGFVDNNPSLHEMRIDGTWVLGSISDLPDLIKRYEVGLIVCTQASDEEQVKNAIKSAHQQSYIRLVFLENVMSALYHELLQPVTAIDYAIWTGETSSKEEIYGKSLER